MMWKRILFISLILYAMLPLASAQNVTENVTFVNLTCPSKFCTNIFIEILNRTFVPVFHFADPFQQINCTFRPISTGVLSTSAHELSCIYPLLNFSSQDEFEKSIIPIPMKLFQQFGNLTENTGELRKEVAEKSGLLIITIALSIIFGTALVGYWLYENW